MTYSCSDFFDDVIVDRNKSVSVATINLSTAGLDARKCQLSLVRQGF